MLRVDYPVVVSAAEQHARWALVLREVQRLTQTMVVAHDPAGQRHQRVFVDVPASFETVVQERTLTSLLGRRDGVVIGRRPQHQAAWTVWALLRPTPTAQPLDDVPTTCSARLELRWFGQRCAGLLACEPQDHALLTALRARGWRVQRLPRWLARMVAPIAAARTTVLPQLPERSGQSRSAEEAAQSLSFVGETAHPFGQQTSALPWAGPETSALLGDQSPLAAGGEQASVLSQERTDIATRLGSQSPLAAGEEPGLLLGTQMSGEAVRLAWRAMRVGLVAPPEQLAQLSAVVVERALGLDTGSGFGVLAVVPAVIGAHLRSLPLGGRVRFLDGADLYHSLALPVDGLPATALQCIAAAHGIMLAEQAFSLAENLARQMPALATPALLGLLAPPGDDLVGVVNAGGAIVLVGDESPELALLRDLLWATVLPNLTRTPLVLTTGAQQIPEYLAPRVLHLVLDPPAAAQQHARVTWDTDGWQVSDQMGSLLATVSADLAAHSSAADATMVATMQDVLDAPVGEVAAGLALIAEEWSWPGDAPAPIATPTLDPGSTARQDNLPAGDAPVPIATSTLDPGSVARQDNPPALASEAAGAWLESEPGVAGEPDLADVLRVLAQALDPAMLSWSESDISPASGLAPADSGDPDEASGSSWLATDAAAGIDLAADADGSTPDIDEPLELAADADGSMADGADSLDPFNGDRTDEDLASISENEELLALRIAVDDPFDRSREGLKPVELPAWFAEYESTAEASCTVPDSTQDHRGRVGLRSRRRTMRPTPNTSGMVRTADSESSPSEDAPTSVVAVRVVSASRLVLPRRRSGQRHLARRSTNVHSGAAPAAPIPLCEPPAQERPARVRGRSRTGRRSLAGWQSPVAAEMVNSALEIAETRPSAQPNFKPAVRRRPIRTTAQLLTPDPAPSVEQHRGPILVLAALPAALVEQLAPALLVRHVAQWVALECQLVGDVAAELAWREVAAGVEEVPLC